jgi:hypothetical protein
MYPNPTQDGDARPRPTGAGTGVCNPHTYKRDPLEIKKKESRAGAVKGYGGCIATRSAPLLLPSSLYIYIDCTYKSKGTSNRKALTNQQALQAHSSWVFISYTKEALGNGCFFRDWIVQAINSGKLMGEVGQCPMVGVFWDSMLKKF